ncbi:uncharacterized protein [Antedon mediterranea]|uniref:uncharacterized protein n=1 Tax=Antedon mediterranea TaxID=105859 RepID=UPI003AF7E7E0
MLSGNQQKNQDQRNEASNIPAQSKQPSSTRPTSSISLEVDTKISKKPCTFFRRTGKCKFGEDCRFAHAQKEVENVPIDSPKQNINNIPEEEQDPKNNEKQKQKKGNCYEFKKTGRCRFGDHCRFLHGKFYEKKKKQEQSGADSEKKKVSYEEVKGYHGLEEQNKAEEDSHAEPSGKKMKQRRKLCRFYKEGTCNMADRCRFFHPQDPTDIDDKDIKEHASSGAVKTEKREVTKRPQSSLNITEATPESLQKLRNVEINQLKVIFQEGEKLTIVEDEGKPVTYRIITSPTDPEWPFDITDFIFDVVFPEDYPREPFSLHVSEEQVLPDVIERHINEAAQNWVLAKHQTNLVGGKIELIFRPFLRWLDRSLENLFTEGARKYKRCLDAKAAGFEFIPHKEKVETTEESSSVLNEVKEDKKEETVDEEDKNDEDDIEENDSEEGETEEEESDESEEEEERNTVKYRQRSIEQNQNIDPQRKGTELRFKGLEIGDGYGTLSVKTLSLIIQCERCKHRTDISTPGGRANQIFCPRCQHQFLLTYRPAIMHQFSAILGYLDLNGCVPFDVLVMDCEFEASCLSCNNQKQIKGVQYGQTLSNWCPQCHNKQNLRVDSTRIQRLFASDPIATENLHTVKVQSVVKAHKDPAIQEGKPLPSNGTCQHYKKSFRWLRFPCCGKCYPCDCCHDDDSDHIFTYANRMLCGFCAKEQTFSPDQPCIACRMNLTKGWSSHWEGGLGCRNKTKMNKGDKQKYSGKNKTVSKKKKEKKEGQQLKKSKSK